MKNIIHKKEILALLLVSATISFADSGMTRLNNWRFMKGDLPLEAATGDWSEISVPHTWNAEDGHNGGSYYRGPGWYQTDLRIEDPQKNQRYFLRFDAVGTAADVFLDQQPVGNHLGGYTAFALEITDQVQADKMVDLRVRADNSQRRDVAPQSGDFTIQGGMHRKAELITKNVVCISPLDHGSPGVFLYQESVSKAQAKLRVKVLIDNGADELKKIRTQLTLRDAAGTVVATKALGTRSKADVISVAEHTFSIVKPHLWHGIKDPYLYTLTVELFDGKERVDQFAQKVGFRFYHIDPQEGFFLNGESYPLHGVNMHQDRAGVGAAVSEEQLREDFEFIEEIGANCLRLAHYPHSDFSYALSDELGLLVWAEIPLVNSVTHDPGFAPVARQMLLEMIRQHGNHCSIFLWSISNEIYQAPTDEPMELLTELNAMAEQEDPTRLTTLATNHNRTDLCTVTDSFAINIYPGWYGQNIHDMRGALGGYNNTGNKRGVGVAEYGAGGAVEHQSQTLEYVPPNGKWHPEQWQAFLHETQYQDIVNAPYCWGSFVWAMFDFSSDGRNEGAQKGVNDKGLMTHDRTTKKDAFYFYKANWSDEPVLHLTSKRHRVRTNQETPVKVYSNLPKVALSVNGKSLGTVVPNELHIAQWEHVKLVGGENRIVVTAGSLREEATWIYDPAAMDAKSINMRLSEVVEGFFRASNAEEGNGPKNAFDDNVNTRWASQSKGAWVAQELPMPKSVRAVSVLWYKGAERAYPFKIETSMDGNVWRPAFQGASEKVSDFETYTLEHADESRYVRIVCEGSDVSAWSSIVEVRLGN